MTVRNSMAWFGALAAIGLVGWLFGKPFARDIPVLKPPAVAFPAPVTIPLQAGFETRPESEPEDTELKAAEALWEQALAIYRAGSGPAGRESLEPLLRSIWTRWPASDFAVRAQILAAGSLGAHTPARRRELIDFTERALNFPRRYFSPSHQASSQSLAAEVVRIWTADGRPKKAWRLCLRLRWTVPRLDRVAPACREVVARFPEARLGPDATLALLPAAAAHFPLNAKPLAAGEVQTLGRYLSNPFDSGLLARTLVILWQADYRDLAVSLRRELLELDPETLWKLEVNARPYGSVKGILRLSLVPWQG